MDEATLTQEIRGRLGDPPVSQLPESQAKRAIAAALREFSRFRPLHEETTLDLVPGKGEYDLPADTLTVTVSDQERYLGLSEYEMGQEFPDMPPFLLDRWEKLQYQKHLEREDAGWETDVIPSVDGTGPAKLVLYPLPKRVGKMAVRISRARVLAEVSTRDIELLIQFSVGDCLEYMGRKRNKSVTQIPTATGAVKLDSGNAMRREGWGMKQEFRRLLGQGAGGITAG